MAEAPPAPSSAPRLARLSFTGSTAEYFRIWIVNVAFTIVTLGAYSAWAKVRRLQYFYRNTRLDGAAFDYHGDPIAIFKGRIVAAVLFVAYTAGGTISPVAALVVLALIGAALPWLLVRSLRFRLHNTSYRGLRFRFSGTTRQGYWIFLGWPLLMVASLSLLGPLWHQRLKRFQFEHSSFGRTAFVMLAPASNFYVLYVFAGVLIVLVVTGFAAALALALGTAPDPAGTPGGAGATLAVVGSILAVAFYVAGLIGVQAFLTTRIRNQIWNHTTLAGGRFFSDAKTRHLLWIQLTNFAATIATLGLFWPIGQVRLARFFSETISAQMPSSFDSFHAEPGPEEEAIGDEVAGIFDFDIAF